MVAVFLCLLNFRLKIQIFFFCRPNDGTIIAPPPEIQVIIDKMASYVIKNGRDFESVVRNKGEVIFFFSV